MILILVLTVIAALGLAWRLTRTQTVTVEPAQRGTAVEAVYATGTVEPEDRVLVKAKLGGHVLDHYVREGEHVKKGQLLARIDSPTRRYALSRGKVQLSTATEAAGPKSPQIDALDAQARALAAELSLARVDLDRTYRLVSSGSMAQAELDRQRARVTQLEAQHQSVVAQQRSLVADLASAKAEIAASVKSLSSDVEDAEVRAPLDGVVLHRWIEAGEVVAQNQTLFDLGDLNALIVELRVDEADIARVRDGQDGATPSQVALSFYAFEGQALSGRVFEILPESDRARRSFSVKVKLDAAPKGLRSGMTAEANVVVQSKEGALLVPLEAVEGDQAWFAVNGRAVKRKVKLGIRDMTHAELLEGASDGELMIVDAAALKLTDGARITTHPRTKTAEKPK